MSGWRDALIIARRLDKVIATDNLPPCVLCNGTEGRRYRLPDAHSVGHLSTIEVSLQDPTGRASGLAVWTGLLGDLSVTTSLGSQLGDEPTGVRDSGYAEANYSGPENGWACLADSLPVRSAGDLPRSWADLTAGAQDHDTTRPRRELCVGRCRRNSYTCVKPAKAGQI